MITKLLQRGGGRALQTAAKPSLRAATQRASSSYVLPDFKIVESTLREGEQFSTAEFTTEDRIYIAKTLDKLGVDYIEMVNPVASSTAMSDAIAISNLGLKAKTAVHCRCHKMDIKAAIDCGVDAVHIYMATSKVLREHSHGKGIQAIIDTALPILESVKEAGLEVRWSCEDTFRSERDELLRIYEAVNGIEVDRIGLADTVGIATPAQVSEVVSAVKSVLSPGVGIEFHTHNDTGMAISNAFVAMEAGATHIDTSILGIGERNGITPLGGWLARLYTLDKEEIKSRYNLHLLHHLEKYISQVADIQIPFNNYVTGSSAFTHKAGVHSKAVMTNAASYELINPDDFSVSRKIEFAHRLTGWNALAARAKELGLEISDEQVKVATGMVKNIADERKISLDALDGVLFKLARLSAPLPSSFSIVFEGSEQSEELKQAHEATVKAIQNYQAAAVKDAVGDLSTEDLTDPRPSMVLEITGHLFDKAVINRIMDLLVDSEKEFKVLKMDVAQKNDLLSACHLRFWDTDETAVKETHQKIVTLTNMLSSSNTTIRDITVKVAPEEHSTENQETVENCLI